MRVRAGAGIVDPVRACTGQFTNAARKTTFPQGGRRDNHTNFHRGGGRGRSETGSFYLYQKRHLARLYITQCNSGVIRRVTGGVQKLARDAVDKRALHYLVRGSWPMSHEPSWALLPQTPLSVDNDPALMSSRGTGYSPLI